MFGGKVLLITGGTGSFGNAVLRRFLDSDISEIRIFSRDEKKQDDMRRLYTNSKLKFYIGDVRDVGSIRSAMRNVDYVFHAAALKQVPSCEFYPIQAVQTNILGTSNVLDVAISEGVKRVICLSTDKAVYPINSMGMSKALMEKVAIAKSKENESTIICVTRYGNVMASRGSVIPLFLNQILANESITITDPMMTRFMMTLDEAVNLVIFAFQNGASGEIFVQKSPAATIDILTKALIDLFGKVHQKIDVIGTRHGEKLFEVLLSREEMVFAKDHGDYFCVKPDLRDLNYNKFFNHGESLISKAVDYNSHNTSRLSIEEMKCLLIKLPLIKDALSNLNKVS
jgi:UDP-N-acetylglucosamine 4,6-dehydratase/5-epimerase